jgi:hypothetical protein
VPKIFPAMSEFKIICRMVLCILEKIEQFTGKGSFEGWAKRVIINNALQKLKEFDI